MARELETGLYAITSDLTKTAVGRLPFEPLDLTPKTVYTLERGLKTPFWAVEKVEDGGYILHAAGDPTGVYEGHVAAFIIDQARAEHWHITEQPHQGRNLFIIETHDRSKGWVASGTDETSTPIAIGPLPATKSIPPQYFPSALFHFVRIDRAAAATQA